MPSHKSKIELLPLSKAPELLSSNRGRKSLALVLPLFSKEMPSALLKRMKAKGVSKGSTARQASKRNPAFKKIKESLRRLDQLADSEGFAGSYGSRFSVPDFEPRDMRVLLCGLGEKKEIEDEPYRLESALASGLSALPASATRVLLVLPYLPHQQGKDHKKYQEKITLYSRMLAAVSALHQAQYRAQESVKPAKKIKQVFLALDPRDLASFSKKERERWLYEAELSAIARSRAKDLVNTPPNLKSTRTLAKRASQLRRPGLEVKITKELKWIKKRMPAFWAVAKGSLKADPPKWIRLTYLPNKGKIHKRIALVGKSVIYDTGGYQVKPGNSMLTMKADMTGGATVLAVMEALAKARPQGIRVDAYLAATPNMIDANAFVADSILDSACGKKIEVRHTDAEGRLTLIDAVHYASKKSPDLVVVIATLTGSATRAVGMRAALLSNHKVWRQRFARAARLACDPYETLDVLAEDYEAIRSKLDAAHLKNTGDSWGRGAQSAAAFVFSGAPPKQPIVQLDIAGGDMTRDDKATGISVQACLRFLLDLASRDALQKK